VTQLQINAPGVVHETVDGEVVIVNLDTGLYFSTDNVGADIWSMIDNGKSVESISSWADTAFVGQGEEINSDVDAFLAELCEKNLVVALDGATESAVGDDTATASSAYRKPELHIYSDMEELLLLDPVHDVGDEGWPSRSE
jgi:hypothetical protein